MIGAAKAMASVLSLALVALGASASAGQVPETVRAQIEADWQRQDQQRLDQIRRPGLVRFVDTELRWPGAGEREAGGSVSRPATARGGSPADKPDRAIRKRDWQLTWRFAAPPGYGLNRMVIELRGRIAADSPVEVVGESVVFTPQRPERQTVFEKRLAGPVTEPVEFQIRDEGAAAVIVTARQGKSRVRRGRAFFIEPVRQTLERAKRLAAEFHLAATPELTELNRKAAALAERERTDGPQPAARAALYRQARWLARSIAFQNPLLQFPTLLVLKRYTQQTYPDVCLNHMPWCSRPGGDICLLSPPRPDGTARPLIAGQLGPGHVHGMDLWYDADRVVFGYARSDSDQPPPGWLDRRTSFRLRRTVEPTHLFEIRIDGTGLRQLTDGPWSDLDPTYLPSGQVAFVSERCAYSLQCNEMDKDETSCNLYIVRPDGSGLRRLSVTKDGDYLPHTLDNGLIAYTRWEYQERLWANIQSIWVVRPDGTGADALFKQHFNNPWALEDVRSIPGSHKLVAIATGHHTLPAGPVVVIDPTVGINNPDGIRIVTPGVVPPEGGMAGRPVAEGGVQGAGGHYQTPWPLSEKYFLAAYTYGDQRDETGYAIYLIDVYGTRELVYRDPAISSFTPIPLRPRPRPPVLAPSTAPASGYATCVVTNVYEGLDGVEPGTIRYLRISARVPWPYDNEYGGHRFEPDVKRVMINWTPARVIGTVPVEADGSACFRVPAGTAVYFQALDADQMEVRRMRSFISLQPGEVRGCGGCHESRGAAPGNRLGRSLLALQRAPSRPQPPPWGTRPVSFLRDVQPVLDRHCVCCHGGLHPAAGIDLSGGLTPNYNRAWESINRHKLIARSNVGDDARITPPYAFGSHKSRLVRALKDRTHANAVKLSPADWLRLVTWIDLNGPYHAGFINKRSPRSPYNLARDAELAARLLGVHRRRCGSCHDPTQVSRLDWIDLRHPSRSLFLAAPLAEVPAAAGGDAVGDRGRCPGQPYRSRLDPDYRAVLEAVSVAVQQTWERPRRDIRTLGQHGRLQVRR